jgi:hypothetical protein
MHLYLEPQVQDYEDSFSISLFRKCFELLIKKKKNCFELFIELVGSLNVFRYLFRFSSLMAIIALESLAPSPICFRYNLF